MSGKSEIFLTMKGLLIINFCMMDDKECNQEKIKLIFDQLCKRLALNRYGKSANQIYKEMTSMNKEEFASWVDKIYGNYISDKEISDIWDMVAS